MVVIVALLICCRLPLVQVLTTLSCGENLTNPEPKVGGSLVDLRLPFYTSGFK